MYVLTLKKPLLRKSFLFFMGGSVIILRFIICVYCYFTVYYAQPIWNLPENGCFHFSYSYLKPPSRIFHKKVTFGKMEIKELFRIF